MKKLRRYVTAAKSIISGLRLSGDRPLSMGKTLEQQAIRRPEKALILFEGRAITYREFNEGANRYSHAFQSLGFWKGDTVALLMDNRPEFLLIHAGLVKIGVVPALINTNVRGKILRHAIDIAEVKSVIVGHEFLSNFLEIRDDIKLKSPALVFVENEGERRHMPEGFRNLADSVSKAPVHNPAIARPISTSDTMHYIYTSGTTGMPKATTLKHQKWFQYGFLAGGVGLKAIPGDVMYGCLPLYHNSGINIVWSTVLMHGATLALRRKFSASNFWDDIRLYNATLFIYIGELLRYLHNHPEQPDDRDNPLENIMGNGLRIDYWEAFQKRFGIKSIIEGYGATEGVGGLVNLTRVPGMIGRIGLGPIRLGEVARYDLENERLITDSNGFSQKCAVGENGMFLIEINPRNPFSGYKGNRAATNDKIIKNVFKPGDRYFLSGDLFKLHKGNYVSFVDRLGDTFKWKGEVVSTNEIADVINGYQGIEDANVYGVSVSHCEGRAGMAALTILPDEKMDWDQFTAHVTENIPVYARPYFVRVCSENDATTTFKRVKHTLQKEGYRPGSVKDPLFFLDTRENRYVSLTEKLYGEIENGEIKF